MSVGVLVGVFKLPLHLVIYCLKLKIPDSRPGRQDFLLSFNYQELPFVDDRGPLCSQFFGSISTKWTPTSSELGILTPLLGVKKVRYNSTYLCIRPFIGLI